MRTTTMTSSQLDVQGEVGVGPDSLEHRGWTVVVAVTRDGARYSPEIFVRSPGNLSGICIPHGGVYVTDSAARDAGFGIGRRWIDRHGIGD
jgi:hypothetical protein